VFILLGIVKTLKKKMAFGWENHPLAAEIQWERHNLFMSEVGSRMISSVVGAGLVGLIFYRSASTFALFFWFAAVTFVALNSWLVIRSHNQNPAQHQPLENISYVKRWHWLNLYLAVIWGILWGLTPFLFFPEASQVQVLSVLMLVVVLVSTPSVTMGCYPDIYITFLTPVFFSFGWHLLDVDFGGEWLPIIIAPFTWVSLVVFSVMIHRTHMEAIILRLEHQDSEKLAQRRNRAKTRFIAVASHDLRQPVQAARLYSEAMQSNTELRNDDTINKLTDSLHSASHLLDRLLDISRMDAGVVKVDKHCQRMDETLNRLASTHGIHAQEKSLSFVVETPQLWSEMDANIVGEILDNLLANAIRYTEKGSIFLRAKNQQGNIVVEVEDTGIGMTEAQLEDAFEEFVQLGDNEKGPRQGMGLGLPIVKRLCQIHGIELSVVSKFGKGTCFSLTWPASDKPCERLPITPNTRAPGTVRILLVEDEAQVADAISAVLVSAGHDVAVCHNLEQTQELIKESWTPDILLTDDRLPQGKNALDVIDCVHHKYQRLPVLVITGNTSPERLTTLQNSNLKVLFKPMSSKKLQSAITELLDDVEQP
jgi:signal transduction histidine kinase/ActR/RegA family two-component response regulator